MRALRSVVGLVTVLALAGCPEKISLVGKGSGSGSSAPLGCVPWSGIARCQHGGRAYAVGRVSGVGNVGLQRTRGATNARVALFGGTQGKLEARGSEVPFFARCGDDQLALASVPASEAPGAATLPECPATISAAPQPATGCAAWTARISWREGATIFGVAVVDGVSNPALAARAGANRARAEAADVVHWSASVGAGGVNRTQIGSIAVTSSEIATCGGLTYVKVTAAAP